MRLRWEQLQRHNVKYNSIELLITYCPAKVPSFCGVFYCIVKYSFIYKN